jgi:hypothetical protein
MLVVEGAIGTFARIVPLMTYPHAMQLFSLFLSLVLTSAFGRPADSLIDWASTRKLTWDDFKAPIDPLSPNAALTGTHIRFDFGYSSASGFTYHISCQFDQQSSWGRVKTDYILSHEQGHFDIAEIYARKLCKAFREYHPDVAKANKQVNKIYDGVMRELNEEQKQYDAETNFSIDKPEQEKWLKKIRQELDSLQTYADYH